MKLKLILPCLTIILLPSLSRAQFWAALPALSPDDHQSLSFSQDEKYVFYISSESGTPNLFRVAIKGGAAQQITKFTDAPVVRALHMLGRPYVVFMKGKSAADQDYHIYRINDDGSGDPLDLTPSGAGVINTIIGESYNGRYLYYTSNKESLKKLDCYRYDNAQNISELVLPNDKDYRVLAWTRDQKKLLVQDPTSNELSLFDIETTERTALASPSPGGSITQALLSTDNHRLIIGSKDPTALVLRNAAWPGVTMEPVKFTTDEHWDYSPNGKYLIKQVGKDFTVAPTDPTQQLALPTGIADIAIAPKEVLIAVVIAELDGAKLELYNAEKKTTLVLAPIK